VIRTELLLFNGDSASFGRTKKSIKVTNLLLMDYTPLKEAGGWDFRSESGKASRQRHQSIS
jgi:hypothetical protein